MRGPSDSEDTYSAAPFSCGNRTFHDTALEIGAVGVDSVAALTAALSSVETSTSFPIDVPN